MTTQQNITTKLVKALLPIGLIVLLSTPAQAQGACLSCTEWDVKKQHPTIRFERNALDNGGFTLVGSREQIVYLYIFKETKSEALWLIPETPEAHKRLLNRYKELYSPEEDTWKDYLENGAVVTIYHRHHEDFGWFFILF
jgi:hypothetical protein